MEHGEEACTPLRPPTASRTSRRLPHCSLKVQQGLWTIMAPSCPPFLPPHHNPMGHSLTKPNQALKVGSSCLASSLSAGVVGPGTAAPHRSQGCLTLALLNADAKNGQNAMFLAELFLTPHWLHDAPEKNPAAYLLRGFRALCEDHLGFRVFWPLGNEH